MAWPQARLWCTQVEMEPKTRSIKARWPPICWEQSYNSSTRPSRCVCKPSICASMRRCNWSIDANRQLIEDIRGPWRSIVVRKKLAWCPWVPQPWVQGPRHYASYSIALVSSSLSIRRAMIDCSTSWVDMLRPWACMTCIIQYFPFFKILKGLFFWCF